MTTPRPGSPRPRRWLRRLAAAGALVLILPLLAWVLALQLVHRDAPPPTPAQIDRGLQQGIGWIRAHEGEAMAQGNSMLWRMLRDAAALNRDPYLKELLQRYRARYFSDPARDPWQRLVHPEGTGVPDRWAMMDLQPYQHFFLYAVTCDAGLAAEPEVQAQLTHEACPPGWRSPFGGNPACRTHQLMGLMMMREHHCGDQALAGQLIARGQDDIVRELQADLRARDPYLQRVLMLYWTGAPERVRPVWLQRVLDAQQPDGGWADRQPIVALPGGRVLQFGGYAEHHRLTLQPARPDFHMTAQGVLLLSLVKALRQGDGGTP